MPSDGELAFVPAWADRAQAFFERVLVHTKGRYARAPFTLAPFQRDEIVRPLFGTARFDAQVGAWVRNYNEAWLELGRGNGKSEKLAGFALYLLCADDEEGAEVYGAAADKDQAALVFNVAARMVELSPVLAARLVVVRSRKTIADPKSGSTYVVIAADAAGNLGQNPHGIVFDEIIAQPSRELYEALRTGLGKRTQSLMVCATTAGDNPESFAAVEHATAERILEDPRRQPNRFVFVRNLPRQLTPTEARKRRLHLVPATPGDDPAEERDVDPFDERNWYYPNPALGDFLSVAILRAEAAAAKDDPTKENAFRQYRLNQWVSQRSRAVPLHVWDASAGLSLPEERLAGRLAFGGLDLAATSDLAALCWVFPPDASEDDDPTAWRLPAIWRYWVPAGAVPELNARTGGQLDVWRRGGFLTVTAGDVIDYDEIHDQLAKDARRFAVQDVGVDPWNATSTIAWAERERFAVVPISQTFRALSPPTKEWLRLVKEGRLHHGGHPVTRWNVDSLELQRDNADNVRPVKPDRGKSGKRIDGVLACILAIDGWQRRGLKRRRSAYEDHGVDVV